MGSGGGTLSTASQVTLSGTGAQVLNRNWSNTGTINFNGGDLQLTGNLGNQSGGVFNVNITNGATDGFSGTGTLSNLSGGAFNVTAAATASVSDTSSATKCRAPISAAAAARASAFRSHSETCPPSWMIRSAEHLPRPEAPPVTMAIRPAKRPA